MDKSVKERFCRVYAEDLRDYLSEYLADNKRFVIVSMILGVEGIYFQVRLSLVDASVKQQDVETIELTSFENDEFGCFVTKSSVVARFPSKDENDLLRNWSNVSAFIVAREIIKQSYFEVKPVEE